MTAESEAPVLFTKDGGVAVVTLHRPAVRNAFNLAMRDALCETFDAVADDPEVRIVVLRGAGSDFCAGGDLREFGTAPSLTVARMTRWRRDFWGKLRTLPKITIAAIRGAAVGSGFEIALACDLRVAAADARFAFPETGRGLIPGATGTQTAARVIGRGRALELVLSGRTVAAAEARQLGLVSLVTDGVDSFPVALALARRLEAVSLVSLAALKRAAREGLDLPLAAGLALERRCAATSA